MPRGRNMPRKNWAGGGGRAAQRPEERRVGAGGCEIGDEQHQRVRHLDFDAVRLSTN